MAESNERDVIGIAERNEEDLVLSDVHLGKIVQNPKERSKKLELSRFPFHLPDLAPPQSTCSSGDREEEDDQDVLRKPYSINDVLILEHCMATPLSQVGLQIWRGSLYLADFIMDNYLRFENKVVIELGAGIGLCSIVAGMFATCAVCTDLNEHGILELCNANVSRNKGSLKGEVIAAELNWTTFDGLELRDFPHRNEITHILRSVDIIIAADVVYSEDLTRSLLACVSKLVHLSNRTVDVYVAVEKRINFTLEAMEAASPAYDYFMSSITEQSEITGLFGRCEDTTPQQYFQYNRTPQLEIWHIEASPGNQVTT